MRFFQFSNLKIIVTSKLIFFSGILKLNMDYLQKANLIGAEEKNCLETEMKNENTLNFIAPIFLASTGKLAVNSKPYFTNGKVNHSLTTL